MKTDKKAVTDSRTVAGECKVPWCNRKATRTERCDIHAEVHEAYEDSRTVASEEAREHAKLLLEMKHISHSSKDIEILAQDLELVQSEFDDESSVMEASAVLRERIGGWDNLLSYLKCLRIGK